MPYAIIKEGLTQDKDFEIEQSTIQPNDIKHFEGLVTFPIGYYVLLLPSIALCCLRLKPEVWDVERIGFRILIILIFCLHFISIYAEVTTTST